MRLIKYDPLAAKRGQELHGVTQAPAHRELIAVEVLDVCERLAKTGLPDPAHARQPDDGAKAPESLNALDPVITPYHMQR